MPLGVSKSEYMFYLKLCHSSFWGMESIFSVHESEWKVAALTNVAMSMLFYFILF